MNLKNLSLQKQAVLKIATVLLFIIAINTSVLTYIAYTKHKQAILSRTVELGETMQKDLNKVLALDVPLDSLHVYTAKLHGLVANDETMGHAMIMDASGKVIFHNDRREIGKVHQYPSYEKTSGNMMQQDKLFYNFYFPLHDSQDEITGTLHLGLKTEYVASQLYTLLLWALGVSLVCFILSVILVHLFISMVITKPIAVLEKAVEKIAGGDFTHKIAISGKDEISELAYAFNVMSDNLRTTTVKRDQLSKEIAERIEVEKRLQDLAFKDQLTKLANRSLFTIQLKHAVSRAARYKDYMFAVLFMDLNRFKVINDSLGHSTGDQLLKGVAERLRTCIRAVDMVARFGGDEFAILLDGINDITDASRVADRIEMALILPFELAGHEVFTSGCIGIAQSASGYTDEEAVLRDADIAMYRAKESGKGGYKIFDSEMHASAITLLKMEADLRRAVEKEQFLINYQPIVSLADGRITGMEALIRWNHPEHGFVPPIKFIPLAEDTGLILPIGEWVLRTACAQNKAWQDQGYNRISVGVNFSSRQFQHQNLPYLIKNVLQQTGLDARYFNAEITESIAMETTSIKILNELSSLGVQISVDDFGTGYSSLGSLKSFPINTLKIDKSFINDIRKNPNVEEIIKAIITMAHSLNMKVVSEGVETEEQLEFLRFHRCDKIQGYLYSRPLPADDFVKLLSKNDEPAALNFAQKK